MLGNLQLAWKALYWVSTKVQGRLPNKDSNEFQKRMRMVIFVSRNANKIMSVKSEPIQKIHNYEKFDN